jgi:hypothetical protein
LKILVIHNGAGVLRRWDFLGFQYLSAFFAALFHLLPGPLGFPVVPQRRADWDSINPSSLPYYWPLRIPFSREGDHASGACFRAL